MIRVLHFSRSPLAGSPIRICNALNTHTDIKARLVVDDTEAYGTRTFPQDLVWKTDKDEVIQAAQEADIIHLHNEIDLDSTLFSPIDFRALFKRDKKFVRQFHSVPLYVARRSHLVGSPPRTEADILSCEIPKLVLAQYHERYYPTAHLVPNIVPISDTDTISDQKTQPIKIFFAPASPLSAWDGKWGIRWGTKGYPETTRMLKKLAKRYNKKKDIASPQVKLEIYGTLPHAQCMELKRKSQISIDELVTGSYHLSSLESLSMGHPTLSYLDNRMQRVLYEFTGSSELPWINVRLEEAEEALARLIEDDALRSAIGKNSRKWMETYWNDRTMAQHFVKAYHDILDRPESFKSPRFDLKDKKAMWFVRGWDDAIWQARKKHQASWIKRIGLALKGISI